MMRSRFWGDLRQAFSILGAQSKPTIELGTNRFKNRFASSRVGIPPSQVLPRTDPGRSQTVFPPAPWPEGKEQRGAESLRPRALDPPESAPDAPPTAPLSSNGNHYDATPHADPDKSSQESRSEHHLLQEPQISHTALKGKESGSQKLSSRIIHRGHQTTRRILRTKPLMRTPIPEHHRPFLGHSLPTLAMLRSSSLALRFDPGPRRHFLTVSRLRTISSRSASISVKCVSLNFS